MKDFDVWNVQKKELDEKQNLPYFKEGEIWWCAVGLNIGREMYGKGNNFRRPILIMKKLSLDSCIGIPMTTVSRMGSWFYPLVIFNKTQYAVMNQIRLFSAKRLQTKLTQISKEEFWKLKKSVASLLGLSENNHQT